MRVSWAATLRGGGATMDIIQLVDVARGWAGMSRSELVATGGAALGFLGATVLAFAARDELAAHRIAITALQLEVAGVAKVGGVDTHMETGVKSNSAMTLVGLIFLVASFSLTVGTFFVKDPPPPPAPASTAKLVCPAAPPAETRDAGGSIRVPDPLSRAPDAKQEHRRDHLIKPGSPHLPTPAPMPGKTGKDQRLKLPGQ